MEYISKNTRLKAILMMLLLASMVFFLGSCRSKKKLVEATEVKIEEAISVSETETILNDIVKDSVAVSETTTLITNNDESIDVETDDPEKEVTVTKEEKDGKTIWTGTNVKNLKITKNDNTTKIEDSTAITENPVDKAKIVSEKEKTTEVKIDFSKENKKIDIKSTSTWVSMGVGVTILLAVLLIIYLLYRKYRDKLPF